MLETTSTPNPRPFGAGRRQMISRGLARSGKHNDSETDRYR